MFSTPLICSSIGVATDSAITFGLAPGYCARTATIGGVTSGYSEIGSAGSDNRPATKISAERTPAKIGRSMKNFEKFMAVSQSLKEAIRHRRRRPGFGLHVLSSLECLPARGGQARLRLLHLRGGG